MTETSTSTATGRKPTHRIYRVAGDGDGDGEASIWTPIGAAWPNKDGAGFSIQCDAVPLQGRIVMRVIREKDEPAKQVARKHARRVAA